LMGSVNSRGKLRKAHSIETKIIWGFKSAKRAVKEKLGLFDEGSVWGKIWNVYEFPLNLIRDITIPYSEDDKWNKWVAVLHPFLTSIFIIWQLGYLGSFSDYPFLWAIWAVLAFVCSVYIFYRSQSGKVPEELGVVFSLVGFLAACLWINFVANLLMDFLQFLADVSGIEANYIGLTLLAWGNSSNDYFVDSALAKKGFGVTAVSGVFAGQFFNLQLGFGCSLLREVFIGGPVTSFHMFDGEKDNIVNLILIFGLMANLIVCLAYGLSGKFLLKKKFGVYLVGYYLVFFGLATYFSFA